MKQRALLLVNRQARRGEDSRQQAIEELERLGISVLTPPAHSTQSLPELIQHYQHEVDLVIIGGGDGSLNIAVDALVETRLPVGIIPLGTANDLARTLGIPTRLDTACAVIAAGFGQKIDLGWVNGKHFFNVASLGLSCAITEQLTREAKRRWGSLAYSVTAMQVLRQTRPFLAEIRYQNQVIRVQTVQIAIGNGRFYGGGMAIAHDAAINDQRLDLYSLELAHWWQIVAALPAMSRGRQEDWPGVRTLEAQEFEIITPEPQAISTDGELTTSTPAHFRVVPEALTVLVPDSDTAPGLLNEAD